MLFLSEVLSDHTTVLLLCLHFSTFPSTRYRRFEIPGAKQSSELPACCYLVRLACRRFPKVSDTNHTTMLMIRRLHHNSLCRGGRRSGNEAAWLATAICYH